MFTIRKKYFCRETVSIVTGPQFKGVRKQRYVLEPPMTETGDWLATKGKRRWALVNMTEERVGLGERKFMQKQEFRSFFITNVS